MLIRAEFPRSLCKFTASMRSNKVTSVNGFPLWKRGLAGEKIESHYFLYNLQIFFPGSPDLPFPGVSKSGLAFLKYL